MADSPFEVGQGVMLKLLLPSNTAYSALDLTKENQQAQKNGTALLLR